MEKIQKALAKARDSRNTPAPAPLRSAAAPQLSSAPSSAERVSAAWRDLRPFEVEPEALLAHRIMTLEQNRGATAFDVMRTKITQTMRANGWRRLAITSPTPACGKSTISLNLAFSFARQPDQRLILAEMDLRRPDLGVPLRHRPERGSDAVLRGDVSFAEQAICHGGNIAVSLARNPVREASELLQRAVVGHTLTEIEATYDPDLMIFDMPPMLANDDMMAFSSNVDCVLIIAGAESTTVKQIDLCERDLASQTNVMGVVLNKCRFVETEQSYYNYSD